MSKARFEQKKRMNKEPKSIVAQRGNTNNTSMADNAELILNELSSSISAVRSKMKHLVQDSNVSEIESTVSDLNKLATAQFAAAEKACPMPNKKVTSLTQRVQDELQQIQSVESYRLASAKAIFVFLSGDVAATHGRVKDLAKQGKIDAAKHEIDSLNGRVKAEFAAANKIVPNSRPEILDFVRPILDRVQEINVYGEKIAYSVTKETSAIVRIDLDTKDLTFDEKAAFVAALEPLELLITPENQSHKKTEAYGKLVNAASALKTELKNQLDLFETKLISRKDFYDNCKTALSNAGDEFCKHRGWKAFFVNLAEIILSIATVGLSKLYANEVLGQPRFFTVPETNSSKILKTIERNLPGADVLSIQDQQIVTLKEQATELVTGKDIPQITASPAAELPDTAKIQAAMDRMVDQAKGIGFSV